MRTIPPAASPLHAADLLHGLSGLLSGKRRLKALEEGLKEIFGVRHVFLVSSGKAALYLILKALASLRPHSRKALIPAYTCYSVPSAIVKAGLKISLSDIETATFGFDHALLKGAIDDDTLCVIPNHLFGIPADMDTVNTLARARGAYVVEDAAQAMGGTYKGRKLGTCGDVGFFSLGRGKNITCGGGGVILTDSDEIAGAIGPLYSGLKTPGFIGSLKELLKTAVMSVFIRPSLFWLPSGIPALRLGETIFHRDFPVERLSGMKAGLLRNWAERLVELNMGRAEAGACYLEHLGHKVRAISPPPYLRFPFLAKDKEKRDRAYEASCAAGLGISLMYPAPVSGIKEIKEDLEGLSYPAAKAVSERLLALPTHRLLTAKDLSAICELIKKHLYTGASKRTGLRRRKAVEAHHYN